MRNLDCISMANIYSNNAQRSTFLIVDPQYLQQTNSDHSLPTSHTVAGVRPSVACGPTAPLCAHVLVSISELHFDHPKNHVPHFPRYVIGGVDTFPVLCKAARHRYQPKYKAYVVKFQAYVSHLGLFGFVSGPHPGACSDATLARRYHPTPGHTYLAVVQIETRRCLPLLIDMKVHYHLCKMMLG